MQEQKDMELKIPELEILSSKIDELSQLLTIDNKKPSNRWLTLKQAWELKGGCAWNTMRTQRKLQPNKGLPEGHIGGCAVYRRETVEKWLDQLDEDISC